MNLLSEDFLSRAAFSDQQYRNICGSELAIIRSSACIAGLWI